MQINLVFQIVISILLIVLITLQSRESSMGNSFSSSTQTGFHTKRGPEKIIYLVTIFLSVIFLILSVLNITIWK